MSTGAFRVVGSSKSMLQRSEGVNLSLRLWAQLRISPPSRLSLHGLAEA